MERLVPPAGIESFKEIRKKGFYYVDKTSLITDLIRRKSKVTLFTRPRRFGKTLTMSMLKCFLEIGADKALFDGLAVSRERELCEQHMGRYPVISLTLKDLDGANFKLSYDTLRDKIEEQFLKFEFLMDSEKFTVAELRKFERILSGEGTQSDIQSSLYALSGLLYRYYEQPVVILIDEYDVPLAFAEQNGYYDDMIGLIRGLLGRTLKGNDYLAFAVLTGCLRVAKESIFTGLNNLNVQSIMEKGYDEYFGFKEEEVRAMLGYYGFESRFEETREWYDGYRFGNARVYCPWDVIKYCYDLTSDPNEQPKSYWINTSSNDIVRRLLDMAGEPEKKAIAQLVAGEAIEQPLREELTYKSLYENADNIWSVLHATGYLTSAGYAENGLMRFVIPNKEIRGIYTTQIQEWLQATVRKTNFGHEFCRAILDRDAEKAEAVLTLVLRKTVSILDTKARDEQKENFYHGLLLGLLQSEKSLWAESNVESGEGFPDILLSPDDVSVGYVIELKYVKDPASLEKGCEAAMRQIKDKRYDERLRDDDRTDIGAYGIAFYKKRCKVVFEELATEQLGFAPRMEL